VLCRQDHAQYSKPRDADLARGDDSVGVVAGRANIFRRWATLFCEVKLGCGVSYIAQTRQMRPC